MPAQHAKNIALTPQLEAFIDELVESGKYRSASEVVRDGLRTLMERRERQAAELAEIQARIDSALKSLDRGEHAEGSGVEAVRRAFDTGLKRAGV